MSIANPILLAEPALANSGLTSTATQAAVLSEI
jgi:hypothetical protein